MVINQLVNHVVILHYGCLDLFDILDRDLPVRALYLATAIYAFLMLKLGVPFFDFFHLLFGFFNRHFDQVLKLFVVSVQLVFLDLCVSIKSRSKR